MCQTLHCLPGPGGLFDQDAMLMQILQFVLYAQGEKQERDQKREQSRG